MSAGAWVAVCHTEHVGARGQPWVCIILLADYRDQRHQQSLGRSLQFLN